ncbi:MAG TPA: ABC transporter permease subunit [Ktedonobacteraceae bacterium]|nr:ABC transporter permease subunit [Ktedonobacteraceae bacterium]
MATTTTVKSVPVAKKRAQGLSVTMRAMTNSSTPLIVACFYGLLILLILAPIYPVMAQANFQALMNSSIMSAVLGGHLTSLFNFSALLAVEVFSSIYGLLFGGFVAWIGGAVLPVTIEDGTLDLALSRPINRTRYYLESWFAVLIGALIISLVLALGVWIDTFIVTNPGIDWTWMWITLLVQWTFLFFAAGLGMLCGSFINASRAAGGTALGIVVLGYLINTFGGLTNQFQWVLKISPFYYAPAIDPLINHQLTWWYPCVLLAAGLVFGIAGLVIFNKRDLPTV